MALIVAGAAVLSWPCEAGIGAAAPALAVIAACFAWAIDNNLTRKVALADARYVAMVKGLAAGATNTILITRTPTTATATDCAGSQAEQAAP
jgi:drug/metabolite transporter (DMT)-like permease